MDSTRGMEPAQPPAGMYNRIMEKINNPKEHHAAIISFPAKQWAAAAVLLLALNIGSVLYYVGENKKATRTTSFSEEVQTVSTYNY